MAPLVLFFIWTGGAWLAAEVGIQQYLPQIPAHAFELLAETTQFEDLADIGPFRAGVLREYGLISHSQWRVQLRSPASPAVEMEIYEMQDAAGAFGVFSVWNVYSGRQPEGRLNVAVENHDYGDSLCFWKGNYFFRLASKSNGGTDQLEALVRSLVDVIPLANLHPVTVVHLPREGLIWESVRFYLGESSFSSNDRFPKMLRRAIGFQDAVEITFAEYSPGDHALFLMGYPTIALADHYFVQMQHAMQSTFSKEGIYMKRVGVLVAIFFGPEDKARQVLAGVHYAPAIKWIHDRTADSILQQRREEALSFLGVVKRSMLLTLFFIMVTVGGGMTVGVARYQFLKRYPSLRPRDEMIRLKLKT